MKSAYQRDTCMFIEALFTKAEKWNQPRFTPIIPTGELWFKDSWAKAQVLI
jgi:hypothetical protein